MQKHGSEVKSFAEVARWLNQLIRGSSHLPISNQNVSKLFSEPAALFIQQIIGLLFGGGKILAD